MLLKQFSDVKLSIIRLRARLEMGCRHFSFVRKANNELVLFFFETGVKKDKTGNGKDPALEEAKEVACEVSDGSKTRNHLQAVLVEKESLH